MIISKMMTIKQFDSKIEFSNNGELSLFFIGTGNAFEKQFFQTNFLIVKGKDNLLVDCGNMFSYAFEKVFNSKISEIKNLLITHAHSDHIGGLEELAFKNYFGLKRKLNIIITNAFKKILWNDSLKGGCHYCEKGVMSFDDYFNQIKPVKIQKKPFEMYEINFGSINIKLFRTKHVVTNEKSFCKSQLSYGLIIDDKILFTGDSKFWKEQIEFLDKKYNFEVIIHDCDVKGYASGVHASYNQLKNFSTDIKKRLYLCHYDKHIDNVTPESDGFAGVIQPGVYYIM